MDFSRKAGVLLHPTSLPGTPGIGTFGKSAYDFIDFLYECDLRIWQILPLGPTGYGDSPYQSFSTFALNPLLVDLDDLVERGWASKNDVKAPKYISKSGNIEFGSVVYWKTGALTKCAEYFFNRLTDTKDVEFFETKQAFYKFYNENEFWLKDFVAYMSIKSFYEAKAEEERKSGAHVNAAWNVYWDEKLAKHDEQAVDFWVNSHQDCIFYEIIQFFAFVQWDGIHKYAESKEIEIIGDVPIFVSADSSDVWANQKFFLLNEDGSPKAVAGVPPDYFSSTGQLWGNPLYDWDALKADGYSWWVSRVKNMLKIVDYVRIDHFRGFESYWAVPFGSPNAMCGEWRKGPGKDLFDAIKAALCEDGEVLPLIAEDLGVITDEVAALRDACGFPGMKVLQFAFSKEEANNGALVNAFLPHNFMSTNCVVYTGTHDNDTTQGLLNSLDEETLSIIASYIKGDFVPKETAVKMRDSGKMCHELIKLAFASTAKFAVIPLQDLYGLGSETRMNMPSTSGSNWSWRADKKYISGPKAEKVQDWLKEMVVFYAR